MNLLVSYGSIAQFSFWDETYKESESLPRCKVEISVDDTEIFLNKWHFTNNGHSVKFLH